MCETREWRRSSSCTAVGAAAGNGATSHGCFATETTEVFTPTLAGGDRANENASGLVITILLLIPPIGWATMLFLLPVWLVAASVILWRSEPQRRKVVAPAG